MSNKRRVLIMEDDASMRSVMRYNLEEEGFEVREFVRGDEALAYLEAARETARPVDLIVSDVKMPGATGMEVLAMARAHTPLVPVILVTAFGTVDHAVEALSAGAADYITKPFRRAEFKTRVARALEQAALRRENRQLRELVKKDTVFVTASERMQEILRVVERLARSHATVLIQGESGTGKELVARRLHAESGRSEGPFVPINCAALPGELLESELFGHERGAFSGAVSDHRGTFERAHTGTLMLDEVGELPLALQAKLLRVLEEGVIDRVGGNRRIPVDVRIVAATNRNLRDDVQHGRFREDLFHRLSVVPLTLPPLRERPEDIPLLVHHFLNEGIDKGEQGRVTVAEMLMRELARRSWPGNVRELKNLVSRMLLLRRSDVLDLVDLAEPGRVVGADPEHSPTGAPANALPEAASTPRRDFEEPAQLTGGAPLVPGALVLPEYAFSLPELEKEIIAKTLSLHGGNQSRAARHLGIPRHVLVYRIEKYGLMTV